MRKIPTLYVRDPDDPRRVTDTVTPGCEWVLAGEGIPTRKWDGTCTLRDERGMWWARREVKPGKGAPVGFVGVSRDENTGKTVGWEPIEGSGFARWHADALATGGRDERIYYPATYELVGPKINGNPEGLDEHDLIPHGSDPIEVTGPAPVSAIIALCRTMQWEGVVWHHPDGRMAKLKVRDYPKEP